MSAKQVPQGRLRTPFYSRMRKIELVSDEVVMGTSLFRVLAELSIRVEPK